MSRLVYSCVFFNEEYLALLNLLLESFSRHDSSNTKYLVITTPRFQERIQAMFDAHGVNGDMWCINSIYTQFASSCARLQIFSYPNIDDYETILYLDTDVLVTKPLEPIFDITLEEKLYAMTFPNAKVGEWGNGKDLFLENDVKMDPETSTFSASIFLFKNCTKLKSLFTDINTHIAKRVPGDYDLGGAFDQDFIIYQCLIQDCFDTIHMTKYIQSNCLHEDAEMILNHFCAIYDNTCGTPENKLDRMHAYLSKTGITAYAKNIIHIGANTGDCFDELEILSLFDYVSVNDNCVFVEPIPYLFKQLEENYNNKYPGNDFTFINKAVSNSIGEVEMTMASESNDFTTEELRYYSAMSSIDPNFIAKHQTEADTHLITEKITVPTTTLNELVKASGMATIDILQIDAEGHDYQILNAYNFLIRPKKIIFEHHHMQEGHLAVLLTRLQVMGYKQTGYTELDIVLELK